MLTEQQLAAIRAQAANTPDGPWRWDKGTKDCSAGVLNEDGVIAVVTYHPSRVLEDADAEFMAASRTNVPALLDDIKELREALIDGLDYAQHAPGCSRGIIRRFSDPPTAYPCKCGYNDWLAKVKMILGLEPERKED